MADKPNPNRPAAAGDAPAKTAPPSNGFPEPKDAPDVPKTGRTSRPNPALPKVRDNIGKGWKFVPATPDNINRLRGQLNRAGHELPGVKVRTKWAEDEGKLYFIAERETVKSG